MNSNKNKNKENKEPAWEYKVGLSLMVIFPSILVYIYSKKSKYFKTVRKRGRYVPGDFNYFRVTYNIIGMIGIIMAVLVVKILKYFIN